MQQLLENHVFTGMQKDLSVSKHPVQFLYDARNIRLTAREKNTLLSVTNERSTLDTEITINGTYLGHCLLNQYLVVFSTTGEENKPDYITRIDLSTDPITPTAVNILYNGNLGFSTEHPIEAIGSYENKQIQKVYWTDGNKQPRMLNIVGDIKENLDTQFDFIRELQLKEGVHIQKQLGASGMFAPGVIQYAFTYYTKYGQESNVFYTSPLLYISHKDRGASPDETSIDNAFKITVKNIDTNFDYLRIYSIQRTSIDGTPIVKRVQDINLLNPSNTEGTEVIEGTSSELPEVTNGNEAVNLNDITPDTNYYTGYSGAYTWYVLTNLDYPNLVVKTTKGKYLSWGSDSHRTSKILISTQPIDGSFRILQLYHNTSTSQAKENLNQYDNLVFGDSVSFTDTGTTGSSVDPTELLYKGGESIVAKTLEQKDNTLFFGNLKLNREYIGKSLRNNIKDNTIISTASRSFTPISVSTGDYVYGSQLTSIDNDGYSVPCAGFKVGDYYRLGVQFQHKSGKWSDPVYIKDDYIREIYREIQHNNKYLPLVDGDEVYVPIFQGILKEEVAEELLALDYLKARAVVVYPSPIERTTVFQGVACPTVYTEKHRFIDQDMLAQSSWFFRPYRDSATSYIEDWQVVSPKSVDSVTGNLIGNMIPYTKRRSSWNPKGDTGDTDEVPPTSYSPAETIRQVEIQGYFNSDNRFKVDDALLDFYSPDIQFDESLWSLNLSADNLQYRKAGTIGFLKTLSDINIQTETPTAHNSGNGFIKKAFNKSGSYGICAGLFYDDYSLDDADGAIKPFGDEKSAYKWMVYPWHRNGSLNNDINRPSDKGTPTAILKQKAIANLRYAETEYASDSSDTDFSYNPQLFTSDVVSLIKVANGIEKDEKDENDTTIKASDIYYGNIDTLLNPDKESGLFFAFAGDNYNDPNIETPFYSNHWWKLYYQDSSNKGIWEWDNSTWVKRREAQGDVYKDLSMTKDSVRMKYKTAPHLVMYTTNSLRTSSQGFTLPLVEIRYKNVENRFGGTSDDALKSNVWIPCGEPVRLDKLEDFDIEGATVKGVGFYYSWGDTYYQRWDCLKTYPFSQDDINQIVEIGSFMLETHVNIDGRYDRNRGQLNNTMMTPQNFNLLNLVYSQLNNFFTYRIQDDDFYENTGYPNQITWTKEKGVGADVDLWTNLTLASSYNMDGSKGGITSLNTWKDQIFCFQEKGVSNILFNSRVQIPTSDGMPIEITNNYKVDGYRYISDGIGCKNQFLIKETPAGIYFIDNISNHLFRIGDESSDLSSALNMSSWFKNKAGMQRLVYDEINHDVYVICSDEALCYSEPLQQFTSFMNYENISLLEGYNKKVFSLKNSRLYQLFAGAGYCQLFGENKPWSITFVSNGSDQNLVAMDKTFTNLEFRATVEEEGLFEGDGIEREFKSPFLPVDKVETWNEFQHGVAILSTKNGHSAMQHHTSDNTASLKRKFRIWRCDIPRDNAGLPDSLGLARYKKRPLDRMRNLWLYVKLQKDAADTGETLNHTELHDMMVKYYI